MTESRNELQQRAEQAKGSPSALIQVALDVVRDTGNKEWAAKLVEQSLQASSSYPHSCNNYVRAVKAADLLCQRAELVGRAVDSFLSRFPDCPDDDFIYETCQLAEDMYTWPDFSMYSDEESAFLREQARKLLKHAVQGFCGASVLGSAMTEQSVYNGLDSFVEIARFDNRDITANFLDEAHELTRRSGSLLGWAFLAEAYAHSGYSIKADDCFEKLENAYRDGKLSKKKFDDFESELIFARDMPETLYEDYERWRSDRQRLPEERYNLDPPESEKHFHDHAAYLRLGDMAVK